MAKIQINDRLLFCKKYVSIYLIYFFFFMADGPIQEMVSVLLVEKGLSAKHYSFYLALVNACGAVLPMMVSLISAKWNANKVAVTVLAAAVTCGFLLGLTEVKVVIFVAVIVLGITRICFNYSFGSYINYEISEGHRARYFSLRDLFLYGGISAGLFFGARIADGNGVGSMYMYCALFYVVTITLILRIDKRKCEYRTTENEMREQKRVSSVIREKRFWAYLAIKFFSKIYYTALQYIPMYALTIGISVSGIMSIFSGVTIFNAIVAFFISHAGDTKGRKWFYVFDIAFDAIPAFIFMLSQNIYLFGIAVVLTMVKDIFAPVSLAYFYEVFDDVNGNVILGVTESFSSVVGIIMPLTVGLMWEVSPTLVFGIGGVGCIISAVVAVLFLPNSQPLRDICE